MKCPKCFGRKAVFTEPDSLTSINMRICDVCNGEGKEKK